MARMRHRKQRLSIIHGPCPDRIEAISASVFARVDRANREGRGVQLSLEETDILGREEYPVLLYDMCGMSAEVAIALIRARSRGMRLFIPRDCVQAMALALWGRDAPRQAA